MIPLLAQLAVASESTLSYLVIGIVVVGLSGVLQLALTAKQLFSANKGERQIEPTQLAGLQQQFERYHQENKAELGAQTKTLNKLDREMGEVKATVEIVVKNVDGAHMRLSGVSRELAATAARVDGIEKRENT